MTKVVVGLALVQLCRLIIVGIGLTSIVRTSVGDFVLWPVLAFSLSLESAIKLFVLKVPRSRGAVASVASGTTSALSGTAASRGAISRGAINSVNSSVEEPRQASSARSSDTRSEDDEPSVSSHEEKA